jgi:predicted AAA+ superfamily ATPase
MDQIIELLKAIILDFQEINLKTGVPRQLKISNIQGKATVCIGVRRSGKSTLMFQHVEKLLEKGISRQNIVHLNFFDDRLHNLQQTGLSAILEAYYSLYPEKKNSEIVYYFFDEIQVINGWESFIDRLMRTEKCEVYITGSSAHMLSKEIATEMRGRALSWEIFPFSFLEYLDFKRIEKDVPLSTKKRLLVQKAFEEYWQTGGFPEVFDLDRQLKIKIHQEYLNAVLFRDLIERHDIPHPKAVIDLAHWLINNTASMYSINSLTNYLKSLGHKVQKSTVSDYLSWFEDAYFLFTCRIFDASLSRSNVNPKKIYCIDHSLAVSVASGILVNSGHLLENLVFISLRRLTDHIHYYKTKSGKEVDFIIKNFNKSRTLIQVAESIVSLKTRTRELDALSEAMSELKITTSILVTRNEMERIKVSSGTIEVIPIWYFLFGLNHIEVKNNIKKDDVRNWAAPFFNGHGIGDGSGYGFGIGNGHGKGDGTGEG